ncbi:hypothetical protein NL482_25975, partial [Klebsiella pneumoniae]|nr:hypothetical protein [Klebsiella pneumoniae]
MRKPSRDFNNAPGLLDPHENVTGNLGRKRAAGKSRGLSRAIFLGCVGFHPGSCPTTPPKRHHRGGSDLRPGLGIEI